MEDGEVEGKIMYDPSRFISFPGFNTEMPRNVRDVSIKHAPFR